MKIAISADLHLTTRDLNPERFETFERLLTGVSEAGAEALILAGDVFDTSRQNYAEFEQICRQPEFHNIDIYAIPGNHDPTIDNSKIIADNLTIITEPTMLPFGERPFLFLPYRAGKTMGEAIAGFEGDLTPGEWVLVGHGDWAGGLREPNPAEPGVYMPLGQKDIEVFKPVRVFLGHIHKPTDNPPLHYPGSPCGLDINETGRRRCLVYDTKADQVEVQPVEAPVLYYSASLIMLPVDDEVAYLRQQIADRLEAWGLSPQEKAKTQIRINVAGYSADKAALAEVLKEALADFSFYKGQEPDLDQVSIAEDPDRQVIAEAVRRSIEQLDWPEERGEPGGDEVMLQALHIIYKR